MDVSITLTRTELALPDLVVSGDRSSVWSCAQGGIGRPELINENEYAPAQNLNGLLLLRSRRAPASLSWPMLIQQNSQGALLTAIQQFEATVSQFVYTATVSIDGVTEAWECAPGNLTLDGGMRRWERMKSFSEAFIVNLPVPFVGGA